MLSIIQFSCQIIYHHPVWCLNKMLPSQNYHHLQRVWSLNYPDFFKCKVYLYYFVFLLIHVYKILFHILCLCSLHNPVTCIKCCRTLVTISWQRWYFAKQKITESDTAKKVLQSIALFYFSYQLYKKENIQKWYYNNPIK